MSIVRVSLLATVVFTAVPLGAQRPAVSRPDSSFLVERGRAGVFEIGATVDEVQAIAGVTNTKLLATYPEGMFQPELEIRLAGFTAGPAITAPISDFPCGVPSIRGLLVRDPRFKTARGIHVGSTLADIKKYLPSATIGNFGADGFPVTVDEKLGLSFVFANSTQSRDTERVTGLWIHDGSGVGSRRCPRENDWEAVYQAVLDHVVKPSQSRSGRPLILVAETAHMCGASSLTTLSGVGCLDRARMKAPFLTGELAAQFFGRNSGRSQVPMLKGASAVVVAAALPSAFPPDSRTGPPASPPFTVRFSSPGFDKGRAVVYVGFSCGDLCGEGSLVLLELRDDKWQVASIQPLWVSAP